VNPLALLLWSETRKLLFLPIFSKNMAENQLKHCESASILVHLYEISIAENDYDKRFRSGNTNCAGSAPVQRKIPVDKSV